MSDKTKTETEAAIREFLVSIAEAVTQIEDVESVHGILMTADESLWDLVDAEADAEAERRQAVAESVLKDVSNLFGGTS